MRDSASSFDARTATRDWAIALVLLAALVVMLVGLGRPAGGQEAPAVQVTSFPGLYTDLAANRVVTVSRETYCPPDGYPIAGGWYIGGSGAADVRVTASYASQRGAGGAWYVAASKSASGRAAYIIPYTTCAFGVAEHAE